jgi:hypothetical protein
MGAGASTTTGGSPSKLKLSKELASRDNVETAKAGQNSNLPGRKLGPEYAVLLKSPPLNGVAVDAHYVLRVGYEALILCTADDEKTPLTYFKYQDIICWGSTSALFQFKVFGTVFGRRKDDHVVILFSTRDGKTLEKITLSSVYKLMEDMEKTAVLKSDFVKLKELLNPNTTATTTMTPPPPTADRPAPPEGKEGGGEGGNSVDPNEKKEEGGAESGEGGDGAEAAVPHASKAEDGPGAAAASAADPAAAAAAAAATHGPSFGGTVVSFGGGGGGGDGFGGGFGSAGEESKATAFFETLKQFAASRCFTVHQGVDLMRLSRRHRILDTFEEMELAVWLWDNTLNRDSFQLIVNCFVDEGDRQNLIFRIQSSGTRDNRGSAALLRPNAPTNGGGLRVGSNTAIFP